jgi:riboflavin kinase / FMN adenylyltransferase
MQVHHGIENLPKFINPAITTGTFDGVHIGHQAILKRLHEAAREINGETVVVTFYPHPRLVLQPENNSLRLLNTLEEKIERIAAAGINHLVIIPFTAEFSKTTSEDFIEQFLLNKLGLKRLIIGYDHHFGRNREGNIDTLRTWAINLPFTVEEIPPQEIDHINVSSTKIRNALSKGDIQTANQFLTYPYSLQGKVVQGKQLGRTLGFPTANVLLADPLKLVPGNGVYAVNVKLMGQEIQGMMNIGVRPTVENTTDTHMEVHLFNWTKELYGEAIQLFFAARIRDEQRFESLEALAYQLHEDSHQAQMLLNS